MQTETQDDDQASESEGGGGGGSTFVAARVIRLIRLIRLVKIARVSKRWDAFMRVSEGKPSSTLHHLPALRAPRRTHTTHSRTLTLCP